MLSFFRRNVQKLEGVILRGARHDKSLMHSPVKCIEMGEIGAVNEVIAYFCKARQIGVKRSSPWAILQQKAGTGLRLVPAAVRVKSYASGFPDLRSRDFFQAAIRSSTSYKWS